MLKLVNLVKDYVQKDQPTVHALKGISINFRRNEFVAILGPSGCGKTTMLNITGGLDRYTSGDLVIEGKSTKNYSDRDWDTYRNHSIGFVFQSYNLISHQTILRNVELALTISGIKKAERKQRAMDALDQVGLKGLYHKKPNQLSGGQMQRVAIARSLVNNPEILLADEPTGALDSQTSIQVMDILKEVAKDRLVIMVTHNPELAYQYANRIITMKDGEITGDSAPYNGETTEELEKAMAAKQEIIASKGKGKSAMSFMTATGLSFANLVSKLKRTILIAVAGSIGIIGVSAVLAVSTGVSSYIDNMQDDMLSSYPVTITETAMDMTSLLTGLSSWDKKAIAETDLTDKVAVDSMIDFLMEKYNDITKVKTNEINADLMKFLETIPSEYLASLSYDYDVDLTNNIFASWKRGYTEGEEQQLMSLNGLTQMYIAELNTVRDFGKYAQFVGLFTDFMNQLPGGEEYVLSQYDLLGNSKFPTKADEMLLVVDNDQTLTDILFAQLGFFSEKEFLDLAQNAIYQNKSEEEKQADPKEFHFPSSFTFDDVLGKKFKYYPSQSMYKITTEYINQLKFSFKFATDPAHPEDAIKVNATLQYDEDLDYLYGSLGFGSTLLDNMYFDRVPGTGTKGDINGEWLGNLDLGDTKIKLKYTLADDGTNKTVNVEAQLAEILPFMPVDSGVPYTYVKDYPVEGYRYSAAANSAWENGLDMKIVGIAKAKPSTNFGCLSRGIYYTPELTKKFMADAISSDIVKDYQEFIKDGRGNDNYFSAYTTFEYSSFRRSESNPDLVHGEANCLNGSVSISSLLGGGSIASSSKITGNKAFLRSMSGLATKEKENETLKTTVYYFENVPEKVSIYPKSFESKDQILRYLDQWNNEGELIAGDITFADGRDELTYTDTIGMIITVVDSLITGITIALVAFTSLSLVVSCFMIAVITYISTMERVKEIGIIRSLGGRKKDVSRLFIAECLIIGIASGVIGIAVTALLVLILNAIVASLGVFNIAILSPTIIIVMICLSVVLNVLSGLIPSMKASHQDPVIALRTE